MGHNAKIKLLTKRLRAELLLINKDLTVEQREQLYNIAVKQMKVEIANGNFNINEYLEETEQNDT